MSEEHTDEWHEGYAAFNGIGDNAVNPYWEDNKKFWDWEAGYAAAYLDWSELLGA